MEEQDTSGPRRRRRTTVLVAGALGIAASAAVVTGVAVADPAGSSSGTTVYACVGQHNGDVRIVAANTTCRHDEYATSWNATGPQGPPGPQGDPGTPGATGQKGDPGAPAPDPTPKSKVVGTMTLTPKVGSSITFDIYSYSGEQQQTGSIGSQTGGAGAGKVKFQPIAVTKQVDASSPQLFFLLAQGTALTQATVDLYQPGGKTTAETLTFTPAALSTLTTSNSGAAADQAHEDLTIDVGAIKVTVGKDSTSWSQIDNTGSGG